MKPVLFYLFGYAVPAHAVLFGLGFTVTFVWAFYEARRVGIDPGKALEVGSWIFVGIVIGSRTLFVLINPDFFAGDPLRFFRLWEGGMDLYGGVAGCIIATLIAAKVKKLPVGEMADVVAQSGTAGLVIGRIGCLFAGCCYGRPTESAWCIKYTNPHSLAYQMAGNKCLYPTQIYSVMLLLAVLICLVFLSRRKSFPGQVAWSFYLIYPVGRFIIEFYRGDARGFVTEPVLSRIFAPLLKNQTYTAIPFGGFYHMPYLSSAQFLSVIAFSIALVGYIISAHRARKRLLQSEHNRDIS